jgi:endonuclease YncB( thermonuclease family)
VKSPALGIVAAVVVGAAAVVGAGALGAEMVTASLSLPQRPAYYETVVVGSVYDGDTFTLTDGRKIRPLVLDSCEMDTPGGLRARTDARALLQGRTVVLTRGRVDRDYFQRHLRYVGIPQPDGTVRDFANTMLEQSHTGIYAGRSDASPSRLAAGRLADRDGRDCSR